MIIGLAGKARSGKDTIGDWLKSERGFFTLHFASALKEIVGKKLFNLSDEQLYGNLKEVVDPNWGLSPRQILQEAGTKLREVHPELWTKFIERILREEAGKGIDMVVCDVRFPNEKTMLEKVAEDTKTQLLLIKVIRTDYVLPSNHISETAFDNDDDWDYVLEAETGIDGLIQKFAQFLTYVHK